jgi:intraflagellar transport protein 172
LDNENVAYIVNAGEISFVEYGRDELAGWIRTERANPHQISVRVRRQNSTKRQHQMMESIAAGGHQNQTELLEIRRVAYLLDARTISIVDMAKNSQLAQIQHGNSIDWLEVSITSLYPDK